MTILSPDNVPPPPRIKLSQIQISAAYPEQISEAPSHCGPYFKETLMNQSAETLNPSIAMPTQDNTAMPDVNINLNTQAFPADSIQDILSRGGVEVQPLDAPPAVQRSAWRTAGKYAAVTLGVAALAGGAYLAYRHFSENGDLAEAVGDAAGEAAEALVS